MKASRISQLLIIAATTSLATSALGQQKQLPDSKNITLPNGVIVGSVSNVGENFSKISEYKNGQERTKNFRHPDFFITNSYGDQASHVTNFTLTIISDDYKPEASFAIINYDISAMTQNDKGGGSYFNIDLLDINGNVIIPNAISGRFMRDHCTYNGPEHYTVGPTALSHNFFDKIVSAKMKRTYSSHYEGKC